MQPSKNVFKFNKFASFFLQASVVLLPFFFLPFVSVPLDVSKGLLLSVGVIFSFLFWIIARLAEGTFTVPKSKVLFAAFLLPVVYLISSALSPNFNISFFGQGFDVGTAATSIILFLGMFLATQFFQDARRQKRLYNAFFGGFIVASLLQIVYIFVPFNAFFSRFFMEMSPTVIGSLNDFAIFSGFIILLALLTLERGVNSKGRALFLWIVLILGLLMLVIVNFATVWILVGGVALLTFVYSLSVGRLTGKNGEQNETSQHFSIAPFIVVLVCLFFIMTRGSIGGFVATQLGTAQTEVRPSLVATYEVAVNTLRTNPITGSGPNRFAEEWTKYRSALINQTDFWDTPFTAGFGLIPSFVVTLGAIGTLAWIFFLFTFAQEGFKRRSLAIADKDLNFFVFTSFLLALYLWVFAIIYVPSGMLFALAFIMTGVFIAGLISGGARTQYVISFLHDPRSSFFSILLLVGLMVFTIAGGYVYAQKFISVAFFNQSLRVIDGTPQSIDRSEQYTIRAVQLSEQDIYYRALSEIYILKINYLFSQEGISQDILQADSQQLLSSAENAASAAVALNNANYQNWIALGNVYQAVVPLSVEGSYDNARAAYDQALVLNPNSPSILLSYARLEIANKQNAKAREWIDKAILAKANYIDAYFLRAQIDTVEGNTQSAIKNITDATRVQPNNPNVFYQLGILKYNTRDYTGAISAFERAVVLSPGTLNSRYFLGLAYDKAGRANDALVQFRIIAQLAPDNGEVQKIVSNLEGGRSALSGIEQQQAPQAELPIEEENKENN